MIENINDFLSLSVVIGVLLFGIYGTYRVFVHHRTREIQQLESEYYQTDSDDSKENFY